MAAPRKRISQERLDRLLLNPSLSRALLEDLGYSCHYPAAKEMGGGTLGHGWIAYLPSPTAKRPDALLLPPNGRICKLDGDVVKTVGAIEVLRTQRSLGFIEAVRYLEGTYLGRHDLTALEVAHNRRLPSERRRAAAAVAAEEPAQPRTQPGLQPAIPEGIDPVEALRIARERFTRARPDPGTGYLVTKRLIDPAIVRRFGTNAGKWAVIRYDADRDEAMFAHLDAAGRFTGYEFRGGVTPANRRGSRGYAASCTIGLGIFGNLTTADRLVVCESGIECLSLHELEGDQAKTSAYVSCAGGPKLDQMERVTSWAALRQGTVVLAFNADQAGDNFRRTARGRLLKLGMTADRIADRRPEEALDWNETLQRAKAVCT